MLDDDHNEDGADDANNFDNTVAAVDNDSG